MKNKWIEYEEAKRRLRAKCASTAEYERKLFELKEKLKI